MKLSTLAQTLIGSEIVKIGGEIREKIRKGEKVYNYTVGDFDPSLFPIPAKLEEAIIQSYRQHLTNYPAAEGNLDLREAIARFLTIWQGLDYDLDEILVASGGRPLIYATFRALVDKGDKVLYPVPSWNNNHYVHFVEGEHVMIECTAATNFMPTAELLQPHLKDATLLALCSPQNPTGTTFSRETLEAICDMVIRENRNREEGEKKLYVMFDQMYWHLTYGKIRHFDPVSLRPEMKEYTIYIDAISKVFAATGVRVGWAMAPATIISKMKAILTHVGAWAPMAEQKGVAQYLREQQDISDYLLQFKSEVQERLTRIHAGFQKLKADGLPVDAIAPEAAIYLTVKIDAAGKKTAAGTLLADQQAVTSYLLDTAKIALVPFYAFGTNKNSPWYRLSVGTCKKEEIDDMLVSLREALEGLK